jgi:hypothetical protein
VPHGTKGARASVGEEQQASGTAARELPARRRERSSGSGERGEETSGFYPTRCRMFPLVLGVGTNVDVVTSCRNRLLDFSSLSSLITVTYQ